MKLPIACLLLYAAWTMALVGVLGFVRVRLVVLGRRDANAWIGGPPREDPPWITRLGRAHGNATENLPIYGAIVLGGTLLGVATPTFRALAVAVLALRVAQSLAHIGSVNARIGTLRFACFASQQFASVAMLVEILRKTA